MRGLLLLLMSALAGYPAGTSALSTDREQPVRVDADRAQLDDQRRVAVYTGNVVLHQGSLRIAGDVLTMRFDERYDLSTLVAEGGPAHFRQQLDSGAAQNGWARRIEYRQVTGAMIFIGAARITQGQFEMKAHRIDYDLGEREHRGDECGRRFGRRTGHDHRPVRARPIPMSGDRRRGRPPAGAVGG